MPKVSVIIPTYNRPHLISRAIQSVLNQTFQDFEIIVVDDGVIKRSESVIKNFDDKRIIYLQHDKTKGAGAARNTGIKQSKGEFLAFLDDDDEWLPEKISKQVRALESCDESVVLAFCGISEYDKTGKLLQVRLPHENGIVWPLKRVLHRPYFGTPTMMIRKKVTDEGFVFDENLKKNQEWDLQIRLLKIGKFYAINEALTRVNILGENEHMGGNANAKNMIDGFEMFIRKHYGDYKKNKKSLALRYFRLAELYFYDARFKQARKMFLLSWLNNPKYLVYLKHFLVSLLGYKVYAIFKYKKITDFFRKQYVAIKKIPLLGPIVIFLRNIANWKIFLEPRLRRRDYLKAKEVLFNLFGQVAIDELNKFRKSKIFRKNFSVGHSGDFDIMILYTITIMKKPKIILETGVASGRSSSAILEALNKNQEGTLYSIDLPKFYSGNQPGSYITTEGNSELNAFVPEGREPGWLVPNHLRNRWRLILGDSKVELPKLVLALEKIDIFYHDSDHSYDYMFFEYQNVWPKISRDGFLLSDDIKWNYAFNDFFEKIKVSYIHKYRGFGIIKK